MKIKSILIVVGLVGALSIWGCYEVSKKIVPAMDSISDKDSVKADSAIVVIDTITKK